MSAFNGMLIGISTMLAIKTGIEEIAVGQDEMSAWLASAQKVARHYSVETTQKTLDWIAFIGSTGAVFGTRAVAVSLKVRQGQNGRPKPRAPSATVVNLHEEMPTIRPGIIEE